MPNYDYHCNECQVDFIDIQLPIADRNLPCEEPCPSCNATGTIERILSAPAIGDSVRLGRTGFSSSWTDHLAQMKSKHLHSTIKVPAPGRREI